MEIELSITYKGEIVTAKADVEGLELLEGPAAEAYLLAIVDSTVANMLVGVTEAVFGG